LTHGIGYRPGHIPGHYPRTHSSGAHYPRPQRHKSYRKFWIVSRVLVLILAIPGTALVMRQTELFNPVVEPYDRALYGNWIDADGDCQDTRQEVLIRDSLVRPRLSSDGCRVMSGYWVDPFSGHAMTDPSELDIDHLVPLAEAHRSGADTWPAVRRRAFANDLGSPFTLVAVTARTNRSKADGDPLSWLPMDPTRWCAYTSAWRTVKQRWDLRPDPLEEVWTDTVLWACNEARRLL